MGKSPCPFQVASLIPCRKEDGEMKERCSGQNCGEILRKVVADRFDSEVKGVAR